MLLNYGEKWLQEIWTFEFHPPVFKKLTYILHDCNKKYLFSKHQNKAEFRNLDDPAVDHPSLLINFKLKAGIYILQKIRNYANLKIQNGKTLPKLNIGIYSKFGQY